MASSIFDWSSNLDAPRPTDPTLNIAHLKVTIESGRIPPETFQQLYDRGIQGWRNLHDRYDLAGDHPSRFVLLDKRVLDIRQHWAKTSDAFEQFLIADQLTFVIEIANERFEARYGKNQKVGEALTDYARDTGRAAGGAVGGAAGGAAAGATDAFEKAMKKFLAQVEHVGAYLVGGVVIVGAAGTVIYLVTRRDA